MERTLEVHKTPNLQRDISPMKVPGMSMFCICDAGSETFERTEGWTDRKSDVEDSDQLKLLICTVTLFSE